MNGGLEAYAGSRSNRPNGLKKSSGKERIASCDETHRLDAMLSTVAPPSRRLSGGRPARR
jgi:hypothetical protein